MLRRCEGEPGRRRLRDRGVGGCGWCRGSSRLRGGRRRVLALRCWSDCRRRRRRRCSKWLRLFGQGQWRSRGRTRCGLGCFGHGLGRWFWIFALRSDDDGRPRRRGYALRRWLLGQVGWRSRNPRLRQGSVGVCWLRRRRRGCGDIRRGRGRRNPILEFRPFRHRRGSGWREGWRGWGFLAPDQQDDRDQDNGAEHSDDRENQHRIHFLASFLLPFLRRRGRGRQLRVGLRRRLRLGLRCGGSFGRNLRLGRRRLFQN